MKSISTLGTAVAAVCMAMVCSSCVVHRDGPHHHHKKKKHHKKPPRHRHPHAAADVDRTDRTFYADAWTYAEGTDEELLTA